MKFLIFFFTVLAVSCADDAGAGAKKQCVQTWKYNTYLEKKSCLKSYMGSVIKSSLTSARRKRDAIPAPEITNSTNTSSTALSPTSGSGPIPTPTKNCSSLNEVKVFFEEKLVYIMNKSSHNITASKDFKIGNEIRNEILDNILQEKRLKEFKTEDFACIKRPDIKKHLKEICVIGVLKTAALVDKIPLRISNVLSKPSKMNIEKPTCKNSVKVTSCVKEVLTNCSSTVQKFAGDLDNMISRRCERFLNWKSIEPKKNGMSTIVIVVIALVCICGSLVAGYGIYKFLKMRRNSGLHTVTRRPREECEMSSMTKA